MSKKDKPDEVEKRLEELTLDLQRTRADFENYRKRIEQEKVQAKETATATTVMKLLPVIDNLERALSHQPDDLKDNKWAQGIASLSKNLQKSLENLNVVKIPADEGIDFDPDLHEAIGMEDGEGDSEVIAEELQSGYRLNGKVIRHSMVRVKRV